MPSVQQLNENKTYSPYAKKPKSAMQTAVRWLVFIAIIIGGCSFYLKANIKVIPDKVYATRSVGKFSELFSTSAKKIVWFGANCPLSAKQKNNIFALLKRQKLDGYYEQYAYLQNSLSVRCKDSYCMDKFIMDNCANEVCIVVPTKKQIIKTKYNKLSRILERYKNL